MAGKPGQRKTKPDVFRAIKNVSKLIDRCELDPDDLSTLIQFLDTRYLAPAE